MALTTLHDEEKQKETLNPGQQDYDRRFDSIARAEEKGSFDDIAKNFDQTAEGSQEDANINNLKDRESGGDKEATSPIRSTYTGQKNSNQQKMKKVLKFAKKRGGIIGLIAIFGISGGILASFFGPASMLISLAENATLTNDSSSTALERRFMKVFGYTTSDNDTFCAKSTKNIKCKMGRISNKALTQLEKKGVAAFPADANRKKTGYPTKNPTGYTIDLKDGSAPKNIAAKDLPGFLAKNPKFAAKVLGVGGAFNLRVSAWTGKHITQKLYNKFNLTRKGGLADGTSKRLSPSERLAAATKKLREKIPGASKIGGVVDGVKAKVETHLGAAKKGGTAYVSAVASCIGVKAPGYIAAGVAAVQLAQILPIGMDVILSPGSKAKASGVEANNSITSEDMDTVGTLLTNKTPRESDGKMTSALDSPILQASLGVNTAKPAVSKDYTPGFSVLTSPLVIAAHQVDKALAPACNSIMSPTAMYTALAIDSATTVALSLTVIGGIIKVIGSLVISEIVAEVAKDVAGDTAKAVVVDLAKNDKIEKAQGQALGDELGISMASFFSSGGMSRSLPVLKESQVGDFQTAQLENEAFQREMDIASLSPFDTSSKYTFLGSIVSNARLAVLSSGSYTGNIFSSLPGLMNFSRASLSLNTNAATNFSANYCGYAEDFGLTTKSPADTPAINMAGLPCTGLTATQMNMDTGEAIDLIQGEGWLDESQSIKDTDTIQDLLTSHYIVPDTPLADFINSCSSPDTGDYLFNAAGCTVPTAGSGISSDLSLNNPRSLDAMSVFLLDYQQAQIINGNDEYTGETDTTVSSTGAVSLPVDAGYSLTDGWIARDCAGCASFHVAQDFTGGDHVVKSATDGVVIEADKSGTDNNIVRIQAPNGVITEYWHMAGKDILVNTGDTVTAGQQIGTMGCVGICYGTHLHFMIDVTNTTDAQVKAITTRPKGSKTYAKPAEWFALYGISM